MGSTGHAARARAALLCGASLRTYHFGVQVFAEPKSLRVSLSTTTLIKARWFDDGFTCINSGTEKFKEPEEALRR
jgi:hypothetical protein